jgi:hypothetical protein
MSSNNDTPMPPNGNVPADSSSPPTDAIHEAGEEDPNLKTPPCKKPLKESPPLPLKRDKKAAAFRPLF